MLHTCLSIILTELNSYIRARTGVAEEQVILANLGEVDTSHASGSKKVVMSLVDIVREELGDSAKEYIPQGNSFIAKNPPVTFSLHLLFSSCFPTSHALEGLRYLSLVIAFFQSKNYFDSENTPALQPVNLESFSMQLVDLGHEEKSALWSCMGTHYRPSVLYKLGMIAIEDTEDMGLHIPEIKDIVIQ